MSFFRAGFLPLARVNFDMEAAAACLDRSRELLAGISGNIVCPHKHLSSCEEMIAWIKDNGPFDFVIVQASTFIDPRFALEYLRLVNCPVVLWGVREPSIAADTRLRLNSLTGVMALSQLMRQLSADFEYIYGNPDEKQVRDVITRWAKAAGVARRIRNMRMGLIGSIPPGYFFTLEEEVNMRCNLGPQLVQVEVYKLINQIEKLDKAEKMATFERIGGHIPGMKDMPEEKQLNFGGFYRVMFDFVEQNGLDALCGRCWPDSFEGLGIAFCAAYGLMGSDIPAGCEADMGGTITMSCLSWLTGAPAYLADVVSLDELKDTLTLWHCGYGSPQLANPRADVKIGGHPNRRLPPVFNFPLKPGRVTVARLGKCKTGYRMLIAGGESKDEPLQFHGTSAVIQMDNGSEEFVGQMINQGWEYHLGMVYGEVQEELATLARLLNIEVVRG